jgi:hypothetical protein
MAPPLTNPIWIYGKDDDTLFRVITLGTGSRTTRMSGRSFPGYVRCTQLQTNKYERMSLSVALPLLFKMILLSTAWHQLDATWVFFIYHNGDAIGGRQ